MRFVQRLLRGEPVPAGMPINPFGGVKVLSGLSEDIKRSVYSLFKPAYMGSAEFEWGGFGEACEWLHSRELTVSRVDLVVPHSIPAMEMLTPVVWAVHENEPHDHDLLKFVTENVKDIYHRSSLDFDPHDPTEVKPGLRRRTEVTLDDWGSLYDEVHDVHVDDRYVTQGDKLVGWFDIGASNVCRSHAWFLNKGDAHAFRDLIKNPEDMEGTGEVLGGPVPDSFARLRGCLPPGKHDDMSEEVDHE